MIPPGEGASPEARAASLAEPRRAWSWLLAACWIPALVLWATWGEARVDEPLALRWARVAAHHPLRTALAGLLLRAALARGGPSLGTASPGAYDGGSLPHEARPRQDTASARRDGPRRRFETESPAP